MRWTLFAVAIVSGCSVGSDAPVLRVEPATIDLVLDPAQPAPAVTLQVFADDRDVSASATLAIDGRALGTVAGPTFTSDGRTGGTATITVGFEGEIVTIPVTASVRSVRLVDATPADAPAWFPVPQIVFADVPLDPGDGAVLPPNLGGLDVDFGADDAENVHEVAVTAAYLDVRVYAPGVPGSRHVALTAAEWEAIARTAAGEGVELAVGSTIAGGGAPVHRITAQLAIADLDLATLMLSAVPVDAAGAPTVAPSVYRYEPRTARVEPFAAPDAGGCIGCHIAISADGRRIAGGGTLTPTSGLVGVIVDTETGTVLATSDEANPWSTAAFDPSGALLTSYQANGSLYVRDPDTAAVLGTIPLDGPASSPAVSPDGRLLAYAALDAAGNTFVGSALQVRTWDVTTNTVGPVVELIRGGGVIAPEFSPDGTWIAYSRTASTSSAVTQGINVVRADGSGPPIELITGTLDGIPRFASPIVVARAGGTAETMGWLAFSSQRQVGTTPLVAQQQQLWLAAFYPERGIIARPFRLPGQTLDLSALHAPIRMP